MKPKQLTRVNATCLVLLHCLRRTPPGMPVHHPLLPLPGFVPGSPRRLSLFLHQSPLDCRPHHIPVVSPLHPTGRTVALRCVQGQT